jgi:hypothetical protein
VTRFFRLELDPEEVDGPWVTDRRGGEAQMHCDGCRTTWFDPVPGPLAVDVDAPEAGWQVFGEGVLPADSPILIVSPAVADALRDAGITSFEAHPVIVESVDGEPVVEPSAAGSDVAGPAWVALWPTGAAGQIVDEGGDDAAVCDSCGRLPGEFSEPWSGRLTGEGSTGDLVAAPGWRHTTFVSEAAWAALQAAGVGFLRAVPVSD